ncbi:enoyl-CoA hydratase-related protein [Erythrobacter sp. AP23]|uniref:enoyl-CoA hydratase-related protein n=1 Tax=Erythrobacter sp. AP23 TaxID=499656 RepID=UPI00076D9CC7|nr:enoyl-CoA hydratase-related protein [Erythrobacter sp. AP23]KWV93787.1 enoyl-CoA hydratase [Erythrobacter sp. AP23]
MQFETLNIAVEDDLAIVELNRPNRLNAFDLQMVTDFIAAIDVLGKDDAVRAIIVTGAGPHFCSGADLSRGRDSFDAGHQLQGDDPRIRDRAGLVTLALFDCPKPLIAAVQGAAVGMGATMTLAMDCRIASTNARFGFVFTRRGIVPEGCSSWFLPRIVGIPKSLEWLLTGGFVDAEEALAAQLVSDVVTEHDLLASAKAVATRFITSTSAVSVALTRQMLWKLSAADHPMAAHRIESRGVYELGRTAEAREGIEAFIQKRTPEFPLKVSADMPDFYPWWEEKTYD